MLEWGSCGLPEIALKGFYGFRSSERAVSEAPAGNVFSCCRHPGAAPGRELTLGGTSGCPAQAWRNAMPCRPAGQHCLRAVGLAWETVASSCIRGGADWILGKMSLLKEW